MTLATAAANSGVAPFNMPVSADDTCCSACGNMLSGNASQMTPSSDVAAQSRRAMGSRADAHERERRESNRDAEERDAVRRHRVEAFGDEQERRAPDQAGEHEHRPVSSRRQRSRGPHPFSFEDSGGPAQGICSGGAFVIQDRWDVTRSFARRCRGATTATRGVRPLRPSRSSGTDGHRLARRCAASSPAAISTTWRAPHRDRHPPRPEGRDNPDRAAVAVDEQHVDRKAHERGVNGEARRQDDRVRLRQPVAAEQPLIARRPRVRHFDFHRDRPACAFVDQHFWMFVAISRRLSASACSPSDLPQAALSP